MAGRNRYLIEVALTVNVSIEANDEKAALALVRDALCEKDWDIGAFDIEKSEIVEVDEDFLAKDAAASAACEVYWKLKDTLGEDHADTRAAYAKMREIDHG